MPRVTQAFSITTPTKCDPIIQAVATAITAISRLGYVSRANQVTFVRTIAAFFDLKLEAAA